MNASTYRLQAARAVVGSKVRFFNPQCLLSNDRNVPSGSKADSLPHANGVIDIASASGQKRSSSSTAEISAKRTLDRFPLREAVLLATQGALPDAAE